jgi:hypothetical protein
MQWKPAGTLLLGALAFAGPAAASEKGKLSLDLYLEGKPQVRRSGRRRLRLRSDRDPANSRGSRGRPVPRSRHALVRSLSGFRRARPRDREPSADLPVREAPPGGVPDTL